ncbi:sensor histidine kinase [Microbacterium invictum]|uniref:histidine kinase n=1 Tax=Microbacterium invictum TaxID=515415 RepID=A0AA40SL56_9MICO|nr:MULTISPECIES: HAMP domain-containing sensor histidine kinase [Microbacterium]MBB4138245.1 signal transduction histidine kinase [Microbacterium invictum]
MDDTPSRRRFTVSVRTRIVAVITLVAALGLIATGVAVYFVERANILESIDDRLQDNLESGRFLVEQGKDGSGTWAGADEALRAVVQRMSPDDNTGALGIIDGRAVMAPGVPLDVDLQSVPTFAGHVAAQASGADPVIGTFVHEDVAWRYLAAPIAVEGGQEAEHVVFAMAYDVNEELAEINEAAQAYLIASGIVLVVIALVALIVSTRLLRPLRQMRETAERVSAQSLSERLPINGRDDVSGLAATMNDMLDRLDAALDSQRQLLSDVGHELKTPITIVRGHLEVMAPDNPDDVAETRDLVVDELERMGNLVQDLGRAAKLHGPSPVTPQAVDAGDLVRQIIRNAQAIAGADVTGGPVAEVVANVDPERVTQAALQLTQNAVSHGGGDIEIGSRARGGDFELWVRDHGPGVPDDAKDTVFERFYRADQDSRGSGLGLNIVQVIARAHGGRVHLGDAPGGGAVFTIILPGAVVGPGPQQPFAVDSLESLSIPPKPPLPTTVGAGPKE